MPITNVHLRQVYDGNVVDAGGLNIGVRAFVYNNAGSAFAGNASYALTDNSTNYVMLTPAGSLTHNTTGFDSNNIALAIVSTSSGDITSISDKRGFLIVGGSGSVSAHASTHIRGGSDEIDGDKLDIDWNPTRYTPTTAPAEVTNADELTAHLAGIDNAFAGKASTDHDATHITGGSDEVDGDRLDIDWNPTNYTPGTTPAEVTSIDHLTAHLYGIDQALANKASLLHAATHIRGGSDEVDGDKLDIDWNPTYYVPDTSPTQVTNVDELTAHLKGIDNIFGTLAFVLPIEEMDSDDTDTISPVRLHGENSNIYAGAFYKRTASGWFQFSITSAIKTTSDILLELTYETSAASGNIRLQLEYWSIADGGDTTPTTTPTATTVQTIAAPTAIETSKKITTSTLKINNANIVAGNNIVCKITRLGNDAADTNTGTWYLENLTLKQ